LNSNNGEEKQNRKRKEEKASQPSFTRRSAQPVRPNYRPSPPLLPLRWPTRGCKQASPDRARTTLPLLPLPLDPTRQPFLFIFSTPTPQLPARPEADSAGRSGPGGHARGMALFPLRRAHATSRHRRMHPMPFHRTMPIAIGGMELGYKATPRALGNPSATATAWWPSSRTAPRVEG